MTHVLQRGQALGHPVTPSVLSRAYTYLEEQLAGERPTNEGWWPAYTAWQAFAVKVLAEGGRPQDSHLTRLFGYADRMPAFALAYLLDAMTAAGESGPRRKLSVVSERDSIPRRVEASVPSSRASRASHASRCLRSSLRSVLPAGVSVTTTWRPSVGCGVRVT